MRARGNKGEVAAELLTDFPERLTQLPEVFLAAPGKTPALNSLKNFWVNRNHPGEGIFHFEGVDSISDAEKLRGLEILLPMEQRVALPEGSHFVTDLIGCEVWQIEVQSPALLGKVRDVFFPGEGQPGTPLLSVDTKHGELLIPLAVDICKSIRTGEKRIEVLLPPGLRELNENS